ncbi:MAG: hypothetical protein ACJ77K_00135 [Bacteroidia bacterium]
MEENNKHNPSDEVIRSRFQEAEFMPSANAWDEIEKRLDEKKRRPVFYYWLSGVLLLLIGGTAWYLHHDAQSKASVKEKQLAVAEQAKSKTEAAAPVSNGSARQEKQVQSNSISVTEKNNAASSTGNDSKLPAIAAGKEVNVKTEQEQNTLSGKNEPQKQKVPVSLSEKENRRTNTSKGNTALPFVKNENSASPSKQEKIPGSNMEAKKPEPVVAVSSEKENTANTSEETGKNEAKKGEQASNAPVKEEKTNVESTNAEKPIADSVKQIAASVEKPKEIKDSVITKDSAVTLAGAKPVSAPPRDSLKNDPENPLRWILSAYFSPDLYMNSIRDNSNQNVKDEKQKNRFTAGLKLSYVALDKLVVRLGVSYSEIEQYQSEHKLYFPRYTSDPFVFYSSLGEMPVDHSVMMDGFSSMAPASIEQFPTNYTYSQKLQMVNVPLEVKYGIGKKWFTASAMLGLNTQYVARQHAELDLIKENNTNVVTYEDLGVKKLTFAGIGGLSFDIQLSKNLSLFIEPHTRINFGPPVKSEVVKSAPYFFGLNGGISFHF